MKRPSSSLAGTVHGPYRIEELIASGGMGQVYRAHDTRLQRAVAVKAIHPHFVADGVARQRFLRETRLACRVSHPYVASVFDVLEADGQPLLVLEYIEGRTLSRVLREERPDPSQVWLWLIEIVDALVAIHRAGVVHRDLKPGNVMITTDGHVKVMDFGLSRVDTRVDPGSDSSTLTQHATLTRDGAVLGTLLYASPEQLRGQTPDRRSDLFSLGILMYEGLKGVHPFGRRTGPESVSAILHDGPAGGVLPPLLREDGRVQALLDRLLAKAPEQRHADAKTVLQELRAMPGTSGFAEAIPAPRWRPWKVLVPVVLLAGLLPVAGIWWLKRPPVWDAPRIALALAPFVDETQTFEGRVAASMVADLLAVDLQASQLVRAEGPEETQLLLRSLPADLQPREIATRLTTGLSVDYVASGRLYREGSEYLAAVEFEPCKAGLGEIPAFTASGATPLLLAERLASGLRRRLPEVPRLTAMRDDRIDLSEITSASERARNLMAQGVLAQRAEQLTEAIRLYRRAVEADSSFALGFARLAGVLNQVGYGRLAREAADSARALAPEPSSRARHRLALLIRATWAEAFERPGERVEAARELAEMFPDEPAMLHAYARALAASERYTEALELIDRALVLDARNLALRLARADLLRLCHRPEEALQALEEIEGLFQLAGSDEGWAAVTRLRGRVRHAQERSADAAEILGNAAERFSAAGRDLAAAETWLEVVNIDLELGKLDAADARIAQALTLAEKVGNRGLVAEALATRAVLHQLRRDYDGATRLYQESIDIGRQLERSSLLAGPVSNLSSLLVWLGRVDEARPLLERAVEIATELKRPDMLQVALINSAEIEFQLGRLDEATRYYETLLQSGSGEEPTRLATFAHLGLAAIHRHRGRLGRALGVLDGAIVEYEARGMKLELGRALLNRARTQSLLSRDDAARSDIDRAAAVADEFPELRSSVDLVRAEMSLHRGDWQRGLHAVSVHPDRDHHPSLLVAACRANLELGRFQPALEACRAALALPDYPAPERTAARALLAEALWRAGNPQAAAELARATLSEARRMDLPLERALAGTVLATADRGSKNASVSCRDALSSLQTYVAGAPAEDRASLKKRPDLLRIERTLSACETRNPRGGE